MSCGTSGIGPFFILFFLLLILLLLLCVLQWEHFHAVSKKMLNEAMLPKSSVYILDIWVMVLHSGSLSALTGKSASCLTMWRTQGRNQCANVALARGGLGSHRRRRRIPKWISSSWLRLQRQAGSVLSASLVFGYNQNLYWTFDAVILLCILNFKKVWESMDLYTGNKEALLVCTQVQLGWVGAPVCLHCTYETCFISFF